MEKLLLILVLVGITGVLNGFILFFYLLFANMKKNPSEKYFAFLFYFLLFEWQNLLFQVLCL
jgi:hypothetical protein